MKKGKIKLYLLISLTITFLDMVCYAQVNFQWAKQLGGTLNEEGYSITTDVFGNVYTTGHFSETVDFDPGANVFSLTSYGSSDVYVSKLDPSGNFIWAKQIGGRFIDLGHSITTDAYGNIYILGDFMGTADFDPSGGVFNLTSPAESNTDIFICKLNSSGNFIWAKQISGSNHDLGNSIKLDSIGNIYTTGSFEGTTDFDPGVNEYYLTSKGTFDIYISKFDPSGNFIWAKQMGGTSLDYGNSIALDASGNVYTTGSFYGTVDFDPSASIYNLTSEGNDDAFVSKLDASGNFIWARQLGGNSNDEGASISVDKFGNVYSTGGFRSIADFKPGADTFNLTAAGFSSDIFISKLDALGKFVWAIQFGGASDENATSILVDDFGNIYTTGRFESTVDFDPSGDTFNLTSVGSYDVFISKIDSSKNFVWAKQFGGINGESSNSMTLDVVGNIYTTGRFYGTTDFDPSANNYNLTTIAGSDIYVYKLSPCPPSPPINTTPDRNLIICNNSASTILSALGSGTLSWYNAPIGGQYLGSGSSYQTANITNTTNFYVQDSACSTSSRTAITVHVNPELSITNTTSNLSCNGGSNGEASVNVSGGTKPYTYFWSPSGGNSSSSAKNLKAGTYTCLVLDSNLCSIGLTINITEPPAIDFSTTLNGITIRSNQIGASYQWIDCNNNNLPISGEINQSFTAKSSGNYAVIVTMNSCSDTSACINISKAEIEEEIPNSIEVYPNPSQGEFVIELHQKTTITITDVMGRTILSEFFNNGKNKINLTHLENGVYFINLKTNNYQKFSSFIINR